MSISNKKLHIISLYSVLVLRHYFTLLSDNLLALGRTSSALGSLWLLGGFSISNDFVEREQPPAHFTVAMRDAGPGREHIFKQIEGRSCQRSCVF